MRYSVEFTKLGNWKQVYNESRVAQRIDDRNYYPLPAFEVGFLFTSHILAVRARSTKAKPHWRFAGNLYQRLQLGTGGSASNLPTVDLSVKGVPLSRAILVDLPRYTYEYELNFITPFWIEDMQLTFWEYVGIDSDNITDSVLLAREDLERIEGKIDNYSNI